MLNRNDLSKIGIGTWGVGGFAERNPQNNDEQQITAMVEMLHSGVNYIEINYWTAQGHSMDLVAQAIKQSKVKRQDIFLSQSIYAYTAPDLEAAKKELDYALKLFETNYIDSLAFSSGLVESIGQDQVFAWFRSQLDEKKIRYINLNNPSLEALKQAYTYFGKHLFSIEIGLNFEIRENYDSGIIDFAASTDVLSVIYQPLRRNRTAKRNWPLLVSLAEKYHKTQNQIILNWIASKGHLPLNKSESLDHVKENLESFSFKLDPEDIAKIDSFRPTNYKKPAVFWGSKGEGVRIDQLSNVFDEDYDKQQLK